MGFSRQEYWSGLRFLLQQLCNHPHKQNIEHSRHFKKFYSTPQSRPMTTTDQISSYLCCCCSGWQSCLTLVTPWTATCEASLSITVSWSLLKLMCIESVMPSSHLIICHRLLLLLSIFPSIRVFSNESTLCNRWPKYWSLSFNISPPKNIQGWFLSIVLYFSECHINGVK